MEVSMTNEKSNESRLVYELFLRASPERLWQALTDEDTTSRYFFGTRVKSSFQAGSPLVFEGPGGAPAVSGKVIEATKNQRLTHTWKIEYDPALGDELSTVTYLIEPRGTVSKLTLIHDVSSAPKTAAHVGVGKDGWSVVLSGLKTLLETGTPLELPMGA
jgi:uncharacterized protein YndB with AHSA1/START domain